MSDLSTGLLTVTATSIIYYKSYRLFTAGSDHSAVWLLLLAGVLLRLFTSFDFFLHEWDERYHALVSKNLLRHPFVPTLYDNPVLPYDYKSWISNHIWLHKPPLPLWIMALSLKVFGIHEISLRLPSIIMTTAGIWLMYGTAEKLTNRKVAYLSAFLYSIHGFIIELTAGRTATDHIDIFFLFFIQLAIFSAIKLRPGKHSALLTGVLTGLAVLCKSLPALIVLPIMALWSVKQRIPPRAIACHQIIALMAIAAVNVPWVWYTYQYFPLEAAWENRFSVLHVTEALEGHDGSIFYHIDKIRIMYGELIYLPLIWLIYRVAQGKNDLVRLMHFCWIFIPVLFFSVVKTKMPAYTLFIAPALFIITAEFFYEVKSWKNHRFPSWMKQVILFGLVVLPIRYSLERIKPFQKRDRYPVWVYEIKSLGQKYQGQRVVVFNAGKPIETMFYTDLIAYGHIPDSSVIDSLKNVGFITIILE